jgi:hypothetical protein
MEGDLFALRYTTKSYDTALTGYDYYHDETRMVELRYGKEDGWGVNNVNTNRCNMELWRIPAM